MKILNISMMLILSVFINGYALAVVENHPFLDQLHFEKGIKCNSCHGVSSPRETVTMMQCVKCHNTQKLALSTKNVKPTNPHDNRHFGTETNCLNCHRVHQASENYCAGCHPRFDFKVP